MKRTLFIPLALTAIPLMFAFTNFRSAGILQNRNPDTKGIHFESKGWNYALAEAKKQKKLVFLDAYTSWCGPCKLLKKNTFTDEVVAVFFNKNFINVTEDMEKGVGIELAKKYQVNAFPTLLITDSAGNLVTFTKGYLSPHELLEFGKYGLEQKSARR